MKTRIHPDVKVLLEEIDAFICSTGIEPTRFGVNAINDGHLVKRLRAGRQPRLATIDKVRAYMRKGKR